MTDNAEAVKKLKKDSLWGPYMKDKDYISFLVEVPEEHLRPTVSWIKLKGVLVWKDNIPLKEV